VSKKIYLINEYVRVFTASILLIKLFVKV